jgi:hypothetical protein
VTTLGRRWIRALVALLIGLVVGVASAAMTAAAVTVSNYDVPAVPRVDVHPAGDAQSGSALFAGMSEWSASPLAQPRGTPTTAAPRSVATNTGVGANKVAGDAFRDEVADRLPDLGFDVVRKEASVSTPFGTRRIDILAERNGSLVNVETKLGSSRYLPSQRAKDIWMSRVGVNLYGTGELVRIPTMVIRGPF